MQKVAVKQGNLVFDTLDVTDLMDSVRENWGLDIIVVNGLELTVNYRLDNEAVPYAYVPWEYVKSEGLVLELDGDAFKSTVGLLKGFRIYLH